jgi:DNA primase
MYPLYDWPQFLEDNDIEYSGPNSRNFIELKCPFCDDHKKHGGIHVFKNYFKCHRCDKHPLRELIYHLTGSYNIPREYKLNPDASDEIYMRMNKDRVHADTIQFPIGTDELKEEHKSYLRNRGFDPDHLIKKYGIKATGPIGQIKLKDNWKNLFAYRLIIPIIYNRKVVSVTARDWTEKSHLRYITYPEDLELVHHKSILYGIDDVPGDHAIVVEGCTDKWKLGDFAVGTFGTGVTNAQINLLAERFKRISIWFDPEPAAQEEAEKFCKRLKGLLVDAEILYYSEGDPGSLSDKEAREIVSEIVNK